MAYGSEQFDLEKGITELHADIAARAAAAELLATDTNTTGTELAAQHLRDMRAIGAAARELAVAGGLDAVERGIVTQAEAADLLHVHPLTVGRWMQRRRAGEPLNNRTTPRERR